MLGKLIFRVVVSTLIVFMVAMYGYLLYTKNFDRDSKMAIYLMTIVYILSFVGMWV